MIKLFNIMNFFKRIKELEDTAESNRITMRRLLNDRYKGRKYKNILNGEDFYFTARGAWHVDGVIKLNMVGEPYIFDKRKCIEIFDVKDVK